MNLKKMKKTIAAIGTLLVMLSLTACGSSTQSITFQGITMDIPSNWKASSINSEESASYEKGDDELHLMDTFDLMQYHDTLEETGEAFKEFAEDDATYEDVSDPVPGKLGGKLDMHTIECTYHARLVTMKGLDETSYPCKLLRVYIGGHDVVIRYVSPKGDFKAFDAAIASANCDNVEVIETSKEETSSAGESSTEAQNEDEKLILDQFQPYLDVLNDMKNDTITAINADEETLNDLARFQITPEEYAEAYASTIQAELLGITATENLGEASFSLTFPDTEQIEDYFDKYADNYLEANSVDGNSEEELYKIVGELIIAMFNEPDFPVQTVTGAARYANEGDGWKLQNEEDLNTIISNLGIIALSII